MSDMQTIKRTEDSNNKLYIKNAESSLSEELFKNPTKEYRGAPFWAWNGKLDKQVLLLQIEQMKRMGMGGFHIHVRTGMSSPYLTGEFMDFVKTCIAKAKEEDMLVWLYDEDRWPSGTAGGLITRQHPEYAVKNLLFTRKPYQNKTGWEKQESVPGMGKGAVRQNNGKLLAIYDIELNTDGTLKDYRMVETPENATGFVWYAYLEHGSPDPWFNDAAYVDTLCSKAIQQFIKVTHETYKETVGEEFGTTIPAIFTDEPQFNNKNTLNFAREEKDIFIPWTTDLEETFEQEYSENLLEKIPEIFWELPQKRVSEIRYHYHNHIANRFVEAYCQQIGNWCRNNGLYLTGHVLGEGELRFQTEVLGEAMRCYRHFGIPGIDMLCDRHEYTTAKQAQSIVRQMGAEAMLSELYGVTGWDCDFRTYKLQGDWQAALGVTVRVPHLFWMTMKGEAKRDYPASIGSQSPWYDQYAMIEDHFARLNTALTRGEPMVSVAVIHPIESYWLHWGPSEQTSSVRENLENRFHELAEILLFGGLDYDYISENELPFFTKKVTNPLCVGKMKYKVVILCGCETLRKTTVDILREFQKNGGRILIIGDVPRYMDAKPSGEIERLCEGSESIGFNRTEILEALEPYRFLDIYEEDGSISNRILHQVRCDNQCLWLFMANGRNPECKDIDDANVIRIVLKGTWKLTLYDTMSGNVYLLPAEYRDGITVLKRRWYMHDSMLLRLEKGMQEAGVGNCQELEFLKDWIKEPDGVCEQAEVIWKNVDVELEEPNMLLLDIAEYSLNGEDFQPEEEILRIDDKIRQQLKIPCRRKEVTQPYRITQEVLRNTVKLRFRFFSETIVECPYLGLEDADMTQICFNGMPVEKKKAGWFVDRCIEKIMLPPIQKGENLLEISVPVGIRTNLEAFYLLGDFGVVVNGTQKRVTAPISKLGFGDISCQGLPFYTGNILYKFKVSVSENFRICVPRYRGALLKLFIDGRDCGNIAFSPYQKRLPLLQPGIHDVTLRLYGTRQNGFAQLHHTPGLWFYQNPNSYRSKGNRWCYEYQLKEAGILSSPQIYGGNFIE